MKEISRVFEDKPVRMVVIYGESWWVLKDVCDALGIVNSREAADRLDDDEKGVVKSDTLGGAQGLTTINESGLYSLILRSNKPDAKRFRKWITSEVLPSIRKTGRYSVSEKARKESTAARNALTQQWMEHGADKVHHYINLTKAEYKMLFGDRERKKADMTREEIGVLMVFEAVEYLKLIKNPEIEGYHALSDSIEETGKALPMFSSLVAGSLPHHEKVGA